MRIKIDINVKDIKVNRVIKHLILADLTLWGGWGLISPVFSVFVVQKVPGATILSVGIAAAIYWIVKSVLQVPIAVYLDKHDGEKDDFYTLITALMITGLAAISFLLVRSVGALFFVTLIQAVGFGLYIPSWSSIFSRHLDREKYALDWSLDSTSVGLASGLAAFVGGGLVSLWGFPAVFIFGSVLSFTSALTLIMVPNLVLPKPTREADVIIKDHAPLDINK
ncbi:MAG: hypothetical protein UY23_C0001G0147 [Candidatus Jorgensenbacteria bacterium GW2011_GWA1_48_11]|uniref:Major facilitator superfamily (MFS) profile domain-containing protein n=1 Tax=Candidatus Jorgensenbacteria bacterium GW2011_GWA1_48_11 TaxID=1618660 RepID=A0A0G1UBK1_9BACT|nr:MAG: hypothetical protein UY23_C0001G0147 [Candidatus Jorgensenbacteria bacterium GW2011_GWA1_48_11]KKW12034.1 MAG: hypothetical protein UY51_C0005G0276 [Candidatus Jorgensenbacteria bacterium GW2011_GWB1_49_9]